jgi:hypothetical protein
LDPALPRTGVRGSYNEPRLPTRPFRKPPALSDGGRATAVLAVVDCAGLGRVVLGLVAAFFAVVLALAVVFFAVVLAFAVVFFAAVDVVFRALVPALTGFFATDVLRAVVVRPFAADLAAAGALMAEMVLAAVVSDSAAAASALVAVFIVFIAVFIACAEVVAFVAASVILVAADDTLVAADETFVAADAGVTDFATDVDRVDLVDLVADFAAGLRAVRPVVFFAVDFFAPAFVRLVLAVVRRAVERVNVLVGTDPSPRVDQLRVDLFHNWRRSTHRPGARRSLFPGKW